MKTNTNKLDFAKGNGLLPVIIQDASSRQVLMQAYMNREALNQTLRSGRATFFSRSRKALWVKGEGSGNYLIVKSIVSDCDQDCLLIQVEPTGPVCHTGAHSCFEVPGGAEPAQSTGLDFLLQLETLLQERLRTLPENSYSASLFKAGPKKIAKKLGEEVVELALEAENGTRERITEEAADLVYHLGALLVARGLKWEDVLAELRHRHAR